MARAHRDPARPAAAADLYGGNLSKALSFIDDGLWGFEITDADGYVLAFFRLRDK